ncbi:patatin-like phospholipase family protein [Roseospira visakhapatnamensis]|uniref:Putative acylesterase/phospholipase RssA n=1 Tax=Roseospira visakhapatnamensis TaxID=390880 RepID=A0A7W6WAR0_9PROT|nr:patatin-like phospholipase family protein [Roseospira visakhapatnamensis]MBB4266766.1 putative acylesterase/phospholipase RssA [Roseospira visakhapatnamensis]
MDDTTAQRKPVNALVLGGGAPNFTLMTGALLAFEEAGFRFDVITGAGGGGAVALSYVAPKGTDRASALRNSMNLGISDAIYKVLPMNYKVFQKQGKLADAYRFLLSKAPGYRRIMDQSRMSNGQKLASDLVQAWWALTTPSLLTPWSKGLCAHTPFITEIVDFEKLRTIDEEIYLNTYNLTDHKMAVFSKAEITPEVFGASGSFPFIYPPTEKNGRSYIEGATEEAFNFQGVMRYMHEHHKIVDNLVIFNSFGNAKYLQPPRGLWHAYGQSIISALIPLDRANLELFHVRLKEWNENEKNKDRKINALTLDFPIPDEWDYTALDWSRSNLERLFHLGYQEGQDFLKQHGLALGVTARAA